MKKLTEVFQKIFALFSHKKDNTANVPDDEDMTDLSDNTIPGQESFIGSDVFLVATSERTFCVPAPFSEISGDNAGRPIAIITEKGIVNCYGTNTGVEELVRIAECNEFDIRIRRDRMIIPASSPQEAEAASKRRWDEVNFGLIAREFVSLRNERRTMVESLGAILKELGFECNKNLPVASRLYVSTFIREIVEQIAGYEQDVISITQNPQYADNPSLVTCYGFASLLIKLRSATGNLRQLSGDMKGGSYVLGEGYDEKVIGYVEQLLGNIDVLGKFAKRFEDLLKTGTEKGWAFEVDRSRLIFMLPACPHLCKHDGSFCCASADGNSIVGECFIANLRAEDVDVVEQPLHCPYSPNPELWQNETVMNKRRPLVFYRITEKGYDPEKVFD